MNNLTLSVILPKGLDLSTDRIMADLKNRGQNIIRLSDDVNLDAVFVASKPVLVKGMRFVYTGKNQQVFGSRNNVDYDYAAMVCLDKDANVLLTPFSVLQAWMPRSFDPQDGRAANYSEESMKAVGEFYDKYDGQAINSPSMGFAVDTPLDERFALFSQVLEVIDVVVIKGFSESKGKPLVNRLYALKAVSEAEAKAFAKSCDAAYKKKASK